MTYQRLSGFIHGRPYHKDDAGNRVPTTNGVLWQSNGPIYEPRAFVLWSRFFMDTVLLAVVLTGLAEPRLLTLHAPQDISFVKLMGNLIEMQPRPNSAADR